MQTTKLLDLPNLFLSSIITLILLYGLLFLVLVFCAKYLGFSLQVAFIISIGFVLLKCIFSPLILDLHLRWFYKFKKATKKDLPKHLEIFVEKLCTKHNTKFPSFGIILDGGPQAFTYGISPNFARIILSQGLIDLLQPEELETVVAHEIGHAMNWDILLITAAQTVPILLYSIYKALIKSKNKQSGKGNKFFKFGLVVYALYRISEYFILWFSRTREYHADRFAGYATGSPTSLARALIKISYGIIANEAHKKNDLLVTMKIYKPDRADYLAIAGMSKFFDTPINVTTKPIFSDKESSEQTINTDLIYQVMAWDLTNPWAIFYELQSTHPITVKRLQYLTNHSLVLGETPFIKNYQIGAYKNNKLITFVYEFILYCAPFTFIIIAIFKLRLAITLKLHTILLSCTLLIFSVLLIHRYKLRFPSNNFKHHTITELLSYTDVSIIKSVPCTLIGRIIGKGEPGYMFSKDFILQDNSGIIFLQYNQPLWLWEWIFAITKTKHFINKDVVLEGWFHRAPMPYIVIFRIKAATGEISRSWLPTFYFIFNCIFLLTVVIFMLSCLN